MPNKFSQTHADLRCRSILLELNLQTCVNFETHGSYVFPIIILYLPSRCWRSSRFVRVSRTNDRGSSHSGNCTETRRTMSPDRHAHSSIEIVLFTRNGEQNNVRCKQRAVCKREARVRNKPEDFLSQRVSQVQLGPTMYILSLRLFEWIFRTMSQF